MSTEKGNLLFDQGRHDEAKAEFEKAMSLNPRDSEAFNGLGLIALAQQRYDDALEFFRRASELTPTEPGYHYNWGLVLANQGKHPEAVERYRKAIEIEPDYVDAYISWGNALANQGKHPEAVERYRKAIEFKPDYVDAYNNWGNALASQGKHTEAIEKYQKAIELKPDYVDAYYNWGLALARQGKYAEAVEKYQKAIELKPDYVDAYNSWGNALASQGKHTEAVEKYRKAIELKPDDVDAYNDWGLALANQGKYAEAVEKYRKAIELKPDYVDVYNNWGNVLLDQRRYGEAIEKYRKANEIDEPYVYAHHNTAYALERQGQYKEAKEEWKRARKAYEGKPFRSADDCQYLGSVLHKVFDELDKAEEIYREGWKQAPEHVGILTGLVDLYLEETDEEVGEEKTARYWKAREAFRKAEELLSEQLKTKEALHMLVQLGQLQLKMEERVKAEKSFQKAVELYEKSVASDVRDEDLAAAYSGLGIVYSRSGDFKKAVERFESAVSRDPDDLTLRSNLAEAYLKAKKAPQAESEYKKILGITSDHVESLIGLGEVYTAFGEDGDVDMYDRAIVSFTNGEKRGRSEEASKKLKKKELAALLYSGGYARVKLYEASKTKRDERQLREARRDFKDCVDNDPEHHKAKRALEKIEGRLSRFSHQSLTERIGPWIIATLSLWIFLSTQAAFFYGYFNPANPAIRKGEAVKGVASDVKKCEPGKVAPMESQKDKASAVKGGGAEPEAGRAAAIDWGYYALLTFGSLIFMVAGLYLPQILKLKVAGIELEKSSVDQITTQTTLGISK